MARVGDIIFVEGTGPVSRLIKLVSGGKWSHCAMYLDENTLIETEWSTKCRIIDIENTDYLTKSHEIISIPLTIAQQELLQVLVFPLLGRKYDFWLIFKMLIHFIFKTKIKKHSAEYLVCSELVGYILLSLGIFNYDEANVANTSPTELHDILKNKFEK